MLRIASSSCARSCRNSSKILSISINYPHDGRDPTPLLSESKNTVHGPRKGKLRNSVAATVHGVVNERFQPFRSSSSISPLPSTISIFSSKDEPEAGGKVIGR
jgi:hypothetical protein